MGAEFISERRPGPLIFLRGCLDSVASNRLDLQDACNK